MNEPTEVTAAAPAPQLLSIAQACSVLSLSRSSLWRLSQAGDIEIIHVTPHCARVVADSVVRFVEGRRQREAAREGA